MIAVFASLLWCLFMALTTSTGRVDFVVPKWLQQMPDENLTGLPKTVIKLEKTLYYPAKNFFQKAFSSQYQIDKSRILQRTQKWLPKSNKFFCDTNGTRSQTPPTSVHELRPGDIDIIGSIGDSLTVGTGSFSYNLLQLVVDHRGTSATGGGQGTWKEFLTIPNILKEFNPKLFGYAYSDSLSEQKSSQFNVAEVGAQSNDLPYMTKELVKRIKTDKRVNLRQHWKMISLMISSNTFCHELCYEDYTIIAEQHREALLKSLLYIKENLPRTIVNLVMSPNLDVLHKFKNLPPVCFVTHIFECPCLFALQYKHLYSEYVQVMDQFQKVEKELMENEDLKNTDDFTVVLQTFTEHILFPLNKFNDTDTSYLASDCFHFSQKGYARAANALWNNMLQPVGRKSTNWAKEFDTFLCPKDDSPYIRTWKNSIHSSIV